MISKISLVISLVFFALLGLGCGDENRGSGKPPASSVTSLPNTGVPKVDSPLSISTMEKDPCGVLAEKEIESLGESLKQSEVDDNSVRGLSCSWQLQSGGLISGGIPVKGRLTRGLSDVFAQQKFDIYPYFVPVTVAGYPAIISDKDSRSCALIVGVRDDQTYRVSADFAVDTMYRSDPCSGTQKVAEFIIAHLKQSP